MSYPDERHEDCPITEADFVSAQEFIEGVKALTAEALKPVLAYATKHYVHTTVKDFHALQGSIADAISDFFYNETCGYRGIIDNYDDGYRSEVDFQFNTSRGCK